MRMDSRYFDLVPSACDAPRSAASCMHIGFLCLILEVFFPGDTECQALVQEVVQSFTQRLEKAYGAAGLRPVDPDGSGSNTIGS